MIARVLLNLLNEFGKAIKCEACRALNCFFATRSINSINYEHSCVRFYLSYYDVKIILLSQFWRENVNILPSFTQRDNGRRSGVMIYPIS